MKLKTVFYYAALIGGIAFIAWGLYRERFVYCIIGGLFLALDMLVWVWNWIRHKPEPK